MRWLCDAHAFVIRMPQYYECNSRAIMMIIRNILVSLKPIDLWYFDIEFSCDTHSQSSNCVCRLSRTHAMCTWEIVGGCIPLLHASAAYCECMIVECITSVVDKYLIDMCAPSFAAETEIRTSWPRTQCYAAWSSLGVFSWSTNRLLAPTYMQRTMAFDIYRIDLVTTFTTRSVFVIIQPSLS